MVKKAVAKSRKATSKRSSKESHKKQEVASVWQEAAGIAERALEHATDSGHKAGVGLSLGFMIASLVSIDCTAGTEGHSVEQAAQSLLTVALKEFKKQSLVTH